MMIGTVTTTQIPLPPAAQVRLDKLREIAGQVVGRTFYGTMLEMMRDNKLKGEYGHGGRGEEVFSAQLHGVIAERMGSSSGNKLGEAIFKQYERQVRLTAPRGSGLGDQG